MTELPAATDVLLASRDELVAMQRQLSTGDAQRATAVRLLGDAVALCLESDLALVALLASARPHEGADIIIARHRRRWKGRFIGWGLIGPLALVGLLLLVVVVVVLVTSFIWRP